MERRSLEISRAFGALFARMSSPPNLSHAQKQFRQLCRLLKVDSYSCTKQQAASSCFKDILSLYENNNKKSILLFIFLILIIDHMRIHLNIILSQLIWLLSILTFGCFSAGLFSDEQHGSNVSHCAASTTLSDITFCSIYSLVFHKQMAWLLSWQANILFFSQSKPHNWRLRQAGARRRKRSKGFLIALHQRNWPVNDRFCKVQYLADETTN